ncbi:MAG: hypothetical protein LBO68_04840 [Synergistaceae bacterium]|nr:hypothetical protein [Synergistaceae bacterium]
MKRKWLYGKWFMLVLLVLLVLFFAALAVAVALDAMVTSSVSSAAGVHGLQGIQGADTTQNVVQQKKAEKKGKSAEAKELEKIRSRKVELFQTITAAQEAQKKYYDAVAGGSDGASQRADLERRIPEARTALAEIKKLTDRELEILKAVGGDESAVNIVKTFYKSMETIVNTLQVQELSEKQMQDREKDVTAAGEKAVSNASTLSKELKASELSAEQKAALKKDVIGPGQDIIKGMNDLIQDMTKLLQEAVQSVQSTGKGGIGGMTSMLKGGGPTGDVAKLQKLVESMLSGVQKFMGTYQPFLQNLMKLGI